MSLARATPVRGPVGSKGHVHTSFYWRRRDLGLWRNMPKRGRNVNLKRVEARLGVSKAAAPSRVPYVGLDNLHSSVGSDRGGPIEVALGTRRGAAGGAYRWP
jgi:hypothetical protein